MIDGLLSSLREKLRRSGREDAAGPPPGADPDPDLDPADREPGDGEAPDHGAATAEPGSVAADELADEQTMALAALKEAAAVGEGHRPPMPELPRWEPDRPPLELDLIRAPETRGLGLELEALARELVRSIVEGAGEEELAALKSGALAAIDEAARVAGLGPREFLERLRDDAPRGSAPEEMDALLQKAAVEGHGVLLGFGVDEEADGEPEGLSDARFTWEPADERRLEVVRLARLFARLESSLLGEPYLAAQLRISRWWFARWWFERAGGAAERGREIRRREWALLDRDLPGLDGPVLEAAAAEGRDRAIAMEIMLRALHDEEKPPRDLKSTLSRKLARETLAWTVSALEEAGLARTVPEDEASVDAGGRKLAGTGETLLESRVDEATAAWLTELDEQARGLG